MYNYSSCLQKTFLRVVFLNLFCIFGQETGILIFSFFIRVDLPHIPKKKKKKKRNRNRNANNLTIVKID